MRKPREKKFNVPTGMLRIQRECKIEYIEPIRQCVNNFIDDDAKADKLNEKIEKLKSDLKGIKDDRENIQL